MNLKICSKCHLFHYDTADIHCSRCGSKLDNSIIVKDYIHWWKHQCGNILYMQETDNFCIYCGKPVTFKNSAYINYKPSESDEFHGDGGICKKCKQRRPWGDYCRTCGTKLDKRDLRLECTMCHDNFTIQLTRTLNTFCGKCGSSLKRWTYNNTPVKE